MTCDTFHLPSVSIHDNRLPEKQRGLLVVLPLFFICA
jgi:hypothetical protein